MFLKNCFSALSIVISLSSCVDMNEVENEIASFREVVFDRRFENLPDTFWLNTLVKEPWDTLVLLGPYQTKINISEVNVGKIVEKFDLEFRDDLKILVFVKLEKIVSVLLFHDLSKLDVKFDGGVDFLESRSICVLKDYDEFWQQRSLILKEDRDQICLQ